MDLEQKYILSVQALKDYAQQAGFNEVVLGLSGGIKFSESFTLSNIFLSALAGIILNIVLPKNI